MIDLRRLGKGPMLVVVNDHGRFDGRTGEASAFDGTDVLVEMDATGLVFRFRPEELREREKDAG